MCHNWFNILATVILLISIPFSLEAEMVNKADTGKQLLSSDFSSTAGV